MRPHEGRPGRPFHSDDVRWPEAASAAIVELRQTSEPFALMDATASRRRRRGWEGK
jgi:hypothetical protein